ncbi:short-chain dehydrogenase [Whalleya microplaca]|nr:short-chain dehydrogenase [Whalleya microplaca]
MSSKTQVALITGANTGIGEAVATSLAADHGYHASSVHLDLADAASISAAAKAIEAAHGRLDALVNNAGVLLETDPAAASLTLRQRLEATMATNLFGQADVTEAVWHLLLRAADAPPRVVFVSSRMGSLVVAQDKGFRFYEGDFRAYDCSKAALNMLALNYGRMMDGVDGMVNCVCPGVVNTKVSGWQGATPEVGAERIVQMATLGKGGPTKTYSDRNGWIPW